jgi:1,4-dihydroxy-2-naphthoate octaprenyltransferase
MAVGAAAASERHHVMRLIVVPLALFAIAWLASYAMPNEYADYRGFADETSIASERGWIRVVIQRPSMNLPAIHIYQRQLGLSIHSGGDSGSLWIAYRLLTLLAVTPVGVALVFTVIRRRRPREQKGSLLGNKRGHS